MSDFSGFSEDIDNGMDVLEHFGILGMKWNHKNGPPYPLGSGDHSAAEKTAAKAAGVKVGSDSGKGSIENVKKKKPTRSKSPKKPLTPEEKREQALAAARNGDKKKITKYIDELSTEELRDAQARAQMKDQLSKKDPSEVKMSKADREKRDVINSGDKELVKQHAAELTYQELVEAVNKVNLMAEINRVPPQPTAMDKMRDVANKLGTFKDVAEKGIGAYNTIAKVYNATHKDSEWPLIGEKANKEKDKESEKMKEGAKIVAEGVKKTLNEQMKEAKAQYKAQEEFNEWASKREAKKAAKAEKKAAKEAAKEAQKSGEEDKQPSTQEQTKSNEQQYETRQTSNGKYNMERAPQAKKTFFNKKDDDHEYVKKEGEGEDAKYFYKDKPTAEQKRLLESEREKDNRYLKQMEKISNQKMSDNDDIDYDSIFSDAYKSTQRNIAMDKAMEEYDWQEAYDYYLRHAEV